MPLDQPAFVVGPPEVDQGEAEFADAEARFYAHLETRTVAA